MAICLCVSVSSLYAKGDVKADETSVARQGYVVSFQIVDASGYGIPGVSVLEKGTANGAVSDIDGKVRLTVARPNSILLISFIGYQSIEVEAQQINGRTIVLPEDYL